MEVAGAHSLVLPYESKCSNLHGHNWIIEVEVSARKLNKWGMVVDFSVIKETVKETLDHKNLNTVIVDKNPTAENIAKWICDELNGLIHREDEGNNFMTCGGVTKVTVQESEGNTACYIS